MFASIIQYRLNPIFEPDFLKLWHQQREWLESRGMLHSSILHRESRITYIAYAQWKNRQDFEAYMYEPEEELRILWDKIEECCNSISVPYRLYPVAEASHGKIQS